MSEAHLPPTGSIRVVKPEKAAKIVEEIARDTEDPDVTTERLLIVLDIDGTILLEDETLSPGVVDAVEHAHRAGHEVMLATGRSWEGTRGIVRVLRIAPEFIVCSNGAVIMKRVNGEQAHYERFHTETFDAREVLTLLREHLPDARYMVELADGRRLYTEYLEDWNLAGARRVTFEELGAQPVCRVVVVSPGQSEQDFVDLVSRIGLNQVSYAVGLDRMARHRAEGRRQVHGARARARVDRFRPGARARDRRRAQRRRHVHVGTRERRTCGRDGAGAAGGPGCRGRDDALGARGRSCRGASKPLTVRSESVQAWLGE